MKLLYVIVFVFQLSAVLLSQAIPLASDVQRNSSSTQPIWLIGNVAVEGGSAPPDSVSIVLRCGNEERGRAFSSHNGEFSLRFSPGDQSVDAYARSRNSERDTSSFGDGSGCEMYVDSPDYTSKSMPIFGELAGDVNRVGTIMLYPRSTAQGATVSATSLAAPEKAKKAFEKGREQALKGKLQEACGFFRRAIQAYPHYAIAWLELGRAQARENDFNSAQQSFYQATNQDSRLIGGYEGIAEIAVHQEKWKDVADSTGKILEISPDAGPKIWFLNSAANFNLGDVTRAETGVIRGLHLDTDHRVPQLEFLYGLILARRAAYGEAIEHLQKYLRVAPKDGNLQKAAAKTLADIQKLAASAESAVVAKP